MKVLVACEESQAVTKELRKLGHEAYSNDIIECSGGHPEWHIQEDVTQVLKQEWDTIIAFPPCFTGKMMVLTSEGYKKIKDIEVGEMVLTHKGRYRKVTAVGKTKSRNRLDVKVSGSFLLETTKNHPFYTLAKATGNPIWRPAEDLSTNGRISKNDRVASTIPPTNKYNIKNEDLWLLGRFVADGCFRKRDGRIDDIYISVGSHKVKEFESKIKCHFSVELKETCPVYRIARKSSDIYSRVEDFYIGDQHIAVNKRLPKWVLELPKEQASILLDGYVSGDGYVKGNVISISSVSKELALGIGVLMQRVYGYTPMANFSKRKKTTVIEGRTVNQRDSYVCNSIQSDRKLSDIKFGVPWNLFRHSKEAKNSNVYNISVEEDESYVVDHCVVHNCTHLCVSGARHFKAKIADGRQQQGRDFFMMFANADCPRIAIENPIGIMSTHFRKPDQIIQPWQFGDEYQKSTCLWLKGLPKLVPTNIVGKGEFIEWIDKKTGKKKKQAKWYMDALKNAKTPAERSKLRSKTFPGIAKAMATQFSSFSNSGLTIPEWERLDHLIKSGKL